ncbi:MAG TPA: protein kinase [Bryobacteraceae bacterium]|nr:protein kinase [Bryobacteraceae bacterium]
MVGRTVQHYQFLEKLGSGGMGDIFKAQDTRLNRFVAVKVLSGDRASDPERRRRFLQEAQAASALNHPNIVIIHDILNDGPNSLMVMEWVQGKTLADLIPKGGLRVPQVLKYAVQMADALQVAHNAGIVHRDLKPGNVMVTESGLVKILDFGLAKLTDRTPMSQMGDATQTIQEAPLTVEGSIIGTVSYMSPEQAQGRKVDTRSDIFSFGVVLYEMATGVRAFAGESALSTLSAILRDEARPMLEIAPDVPPGLEQVVHRCLRKSPDDRWQTTKEIQGALMGLKRESDSGSLYGLRPVVAATPAPAPAASVLGSASAVPSAPASMTAGAPTVAPSSTAPAPPTSSVAPPKAVFSAPVAASMAGGLLFMLVAGIGSWYWIKHKQQAAATPAPIVATAPEIPPAPADTPPLPPADQEMTNDTVVEMVQAKVPLYLILTQIRNSKTNFNLSASEVIRLTKAGVPAVVIDAMRDPTKIPGTAMAPPTVATNTKPQPKTAPAPVQSAPTPAPPVQTAPAPPTPTPAPVVVETQPAPAPAPPPPARPAIHPVTAANGLPFPIVLAEDISGTAEEGQAVHFTAARDFKIGDDVIIAKGAAVTGAIAEGARKKFIVNTKMTLRLIEATGVGGNKIRVRATSAASRDGVSTRPVDTGVKKPKDIAAVQGTEYIAYIDGEQTVPGRK